MLTRKTFNIPCFSLGSAPHRMIPQQVAAGIAGDDQAVSGCAFQESRIGQEGDTDQRRPPKAKLAMAIRMNMIRRAGSLSI